MVELVFIHGWGFDASVWDAIAADLKDFPQQRVDLGFFGAPMPVQETQNKKILIGHSLGFMHGLRQRQDWVGWVAINSFCRFTPDCVPPAALRDMQRKLASDAQQTLNGFYSFVGAGGGDTPKTNPHIDALRHGLDELRDGDLTEALKTMSVKGLVLAGRNDPLVPRAATEALAASANSPSAMAWHNTAGHLLPLREAFWCAENIRKFVQNQ